MRRKMIIRGWIIVAVILMTLSVTLAAAEAKRRPSTFVVGRGGVVLPAGDWCEHGWQPRENVEIALGYHFLPFLALEAGFHHFKCYWEQATPNWIDIKIYANGVILTPKLTYPLKRFEFYAGAGAGYYWLMEGTHVIVPLGEGYGEVTDASGAFMPLRGHPLTFSGGST